MSTHLVTAVEMAREAGICRKLFRRQLRKARFPWHVLNDRWTVPTDSSQHDDMRRVLAAIVRGR